MKLILPTLLLFLIMAVPAMAQTRKITGQVTATGTGALAGVTVQVKNTKTGVSTDASGRYSLDVPTSGDPVLIFRFMGFKTVETKVNGRSEINIELTEEASSLNDVVIIGYGTARRRDLTGSVSSVNAKQIKDIPINSAAQALTGRLAGVQVTGSEGSPNADVMIRVRGGGSITQDNSPLYVIDGVQVENALSSISPQDIASIDVLKDASTTAIYGARGANGVVIITTKGGRNAKTTLNYSGFMGFRKLANKLEVMKPYDFVTYWYERTRGSVADSTAFARAYGTTWDTLANYKNAPFADWQDEMFGRKALMQTHNVSVNGGNAATQYNLSLTSNKEEGVMLRSDFDRKLASFKFDHTLNKIIKVGFNTRYNHTVVNGAGTTNEGSASTNRLRHSLKYRPLLMKGLGIDDFDQEYWLETNANSLSLGNPILLNAAEYRKNISDILNLSGYANIDLTKFLSFRSTFGYDLNTEERRAFDDTLTSNARQYGVAPLANVQNIKKVTLNNSNVLTFNNSQLEGAFNKKNEITVLLGHEIYESRINTNSIETRYFPIGITPEWALANMNLGSPPQGVQQPKPVTTEITSRLVSFFGRVNYAYDKKYLLTFSMRGDGSSKFAEANKWGYFPSGSVAWRLSNEDFLKDKLGPVSDLKIRAAYGQAGNNRINDFLYQMQYSAIQQSVSFPQYGLNEQVVAALAPVALANLDLLWETTISRNLGLDLALWNGRLVFNADFYKNTTDNLLVAAPISPTLGYDKQMQNVGATTNKGMEFQVNAIPIQQKDFNWNLNFNISFNKNTVDRLAAKQVNGYLQNSGWFHPTNATADYIVRVGDPVGAIWGLETDGFYRIEDFDYDAATRVYTLKKGVPSNNSITSTPPQPGTLKFKDLNGDSVITEKDRKVIGVAQPKFFGGLSQQFSYKQFDLSVFVNFQVGNDVFNANRLEFTSGYTNNSNLLAIMNDRWRTVNDRGEVVTDPVALAELNKNAKIWRPGTQAASFIAHSWAVEDGSFLRLNNISLGYTLPPSLLKKMRMQTLRIYGTVNNVAIWTKYSGYDPEVSTRRATGVTPGVDFSAYPRSRSFLLGLNLSL